MGLIIEKCVLCGEDFVGLGNNPHPLADNGRCCDKCDIKVVSERLKRFHKFQEDTRNKNNGH